MYVIGLDIGTSGVKSSVLDDKANVLYHAYREYDLISPMADQYEIDPDLIFQKALEVLEESTRNCNRKNIRAICVTSFGESLVCMDKNDQVLSNSMIYMDQRGSEECKEFLDIITGEQILSMSGQFANPMFGIYKLKWMISHKPELQDKIHRISFIADFVTYKLGADHICDYSLAARSGMFSIKEKKWWDTALSFANIDAHKLPRPVPSGSIVGTMSKKIAERLDMSADVKLIIGGHDQIVAALGSGAFQNGDVTNGLGTVDCMIPITSAHLIDNSKLARYKLCLVPFFSDEQYVTYAFMTTGGAIMKWFRDTFAKDLSNQKNAYEILNCELPPHPTDLFVIPYFAGGSTPDLDAITPAVISGMRLSTTRGELFRAFMEGETYEMKLALDSLEDSGIQVQRIISVGGGSHSDAWMQIRSNIFNRKLYVAQNKEAGILGSAILCYANLGLYRDIREAQKFLTQIERSYDPNQFHAEIYSHRIKKYQDLYKSIKGVYQTLC